MASRSTPAVSFFEAIGDAKVVLCLGSGGVGKTTAAAALAIALAQQGQRVVVLTIDPAQRLADALGQSDGLGNEPRLVEGAWRLQHTSESELGDANDTSTSTSTKGELWAAMLDPTETLTSIVQAETTDPVVAERILNNRLFVNLTTSLSGTNEYMATERLFQLVSDDRFDRVIVDTPPSRHAIDFLDSPGRLTRFVDHRLYRSVFAPKSGVFKTLSAGSRRLLGLLGRLVGSDLVDDVVSFFADFEGLDQGFKRRAESISALLASEQSSYVLVTSARTDPINEAQWILNNLTQRNLGADAIIVNRVLPLNLTGPATDTSRSGTSRSGTSKSDDPIAANFSELSVLAERQAALTSTLAGSFIAVLPEQQEPVNSVSGLVNLAHVMRNQNLQS